MHPERIAQIPLGLIALFMAPAAVQATVTPRSFFDDFPLGRHWISGTGDAYNEHLVRDVGGLFAAMIIVTVWTLSRRHPTRPIATAWLIQGALHPVVPWSSSPRLSNDRSTRAHRIVGRCSGSGGHHHLDRPEPAAWH